ncbi:hypothetical protein [Exiguobacterium sp. s133]|uniref:hypothetical protein n=1 Tax=Exiguobacterium sp. s133 TaxID=2751213 RepID=UPI001BE67FFA|nr:hypothetical protein [Exiguobacterium sp. s133]
MFLLRNIMLFFIILIKFESYLMRKNKIGIKNFAIVFFIWLLITAIFKLITGNIFKFNLVILSFIALIIILLFIFNFEIMSTNLKKIFNSFTIKSYVVCLGFMSIIFIFIIQSLFFILDINLKEELSEKESFFIIYFCIFIESLTWFTYHLVYKKVDIQEIKIKLAAYSAVLATILLIMEYFKGDNLKIPLSFIALSYLWITYLIELESKERID